MLPDLYKIFVMKDIFEKAEQPEVLEAYIKKLQLCKNDENLLINKYCLRVADKKQAYDCKISIRQYYKLLNKILIRAYDAMKVRIRYTF